MKKTLLLILSMVFYLGMQAAVTFSYTVDPKEGETTSLSSIAISYEDGVQLNAKESAWGNAKLYNESNEPVAEVMLATPIGTYGQTYTGYQFTLGEDGSGMTISDIGEYYFVIPEGYISFYDSANKTWVECDEISVHYVVVGEGETSRPQDLTYEVNPAEGKVPSLSKITFLREAGIINQVGETGQMTLSKLYLENESGRSVAFVSDVSDDADENWSLYSTSITYELTSEISTEGTYYFIVPAGAFAMYDNGNYFDCEDIKLTYYVTGISDDHEYSIDPEEGEVSSLHSITISYDDGIKLNAKESQWGNMKVYDEGGNEVVEVVYASPIIGEGYYTEATYIGYTFSLGKDLSSQDVTAAGEYDFVIPAGYISFYDAETGQYVETTEDITAHYIIVSSGDQPQNLTYDVDPAEGEVTSLSKITFLREAGIVNQVGEEGQMALSNLYVEDESGNVVAYVGGVSEDADDNWKLYSTSVTYELTNDVVDEGTYHFIVPAGAFAMYDNGDYIDCENIRLTYYVTGGAEAAGLMFDPESNTTHESLSGFTVSYTGDGGMSVTTMPNDGASVYLGGGDGEEYTYATYEEIYDDDSGLCVAVEFTFAQELTEDGTYDVVIPAELLYYGHGGVNDEEIILVYTIESKGETTGINGISINDENVEGIYSTSGQKLNTTQKGVNIVRYSDGTVKKIYIK